LEDCKFKISFHSRTEQRNVQVSYGCGATWTASYCPKMEEEVE